VCSSDLRVFALQNAGDKTAADQFIERYTSWDDAVHGALARKYLTLPGYDDQLADFSILGQ